MAKYDKGKSGSELQEKTTKISLAVLPRSAFVLSSVFLSARQKSHV